MIRRRLRVLELSERHQSRPRRPANGKHTDLRPIWIFSGRTRNAVSSRYLPEGVPDRRSVSRLNGHHEGSIAI